MKNFASDIAMFFLDIAQTFIVAFAFFLFIYGFIVQPHKVSGGSMETTLHDGELILTNKIDYRLDKPKRGDVITFKSPQDSSKDFIKRIIGLPKEKVEINNNSVKVYNSNHPDGFVLNETYLDPNQVTEEGLAFRNGEQVEIPQNEYMVMGDNRLNSFDSRAWGTVKKDAIIGKAWFVYWPFNRAGFKPSHTYKD